MRFTLRVSPADRSSILRALVPLLIGAAVYAPSLRGSFVWDDGHFLHRWIAGSSSFKEILFPRPDLLDAPYYKPVAAGTSYLLFKLFGSWSPGWRLFGLLLHLVTIASFQRLLQRWWLAGRPSAANAAMIGAAAFACWPATSEALGWISARSEVLMGSLLVPALILHLKARDEGRTSLAASALFFLAMLAKETSLAFLPVAVAATVLLPAGEGARVQGRPAMTASALWLPYVLAYVAYAALRRLTLGAGASIAAVAAERVGLGTLLPAFDAWGYYVREALLIGPGAPYVEVVPSGPQILALAALGVILFAASLAAGRRYALAGLWFLLFLGPPLAIVAASSSITPVALRYLYVPLLAIGAVVGLLATHVPAFVTSRAGAAAGVALAVAFGFLIQPRVAPWMDGKALWERAYRDDPRSVLANDNLAAYAARDGEFERAENLLRVGAYTARHRDDAQRHHALVRLANFYVDRQRYREARFTMSYASGFEASREALAMAKTLAWTLELLEHRDPATGELRIPRETLGRHVALLEHAASLDPLNRTCRTLLASLYESMGEPVRARVVHSEIVRLTLSSPDVQRAAQQRVDALTTRIRDEPDPVRRLYFRAQEAELAQDAKGAIAAYEQALALAPERTDLLVPLAALRVGDSPADARRLMERASVLAPSDPAIWFNLGLYCGADEDFDAAAAAFARAIEIRPGWPKAHLHRARALERTGDLDGARVEYRRFLAQYTEDYETRHLIERRLRQLEEPAGPGTKIVPENAPGP